MVPGTMRAALFVSGAAIVLSLDSRRFGRWPAVPPGSIRLFRCRVYENGAEGVTAVGVPEGILIADCSIFAAERELLRVYEVSIPFIELGEVKNLLFTSGEPAYNSTDSTQTEALRLPANNPPEKSWAPTSAPEVNTYWQLQVR
jgi:hypothetical protein